MLVTESEQPQPDDDDPVPRSKPSREQSTTPGNEDQTVSEDGQ